MLFKVLHVIYNRYRHFNATDSLLYSILNGPFTFWGFLQQEKQPAESGHYQVFKPLCWSYRVHKSNRNSSLQSGIHWSSTICHGKGGTLKMNVALIVSSTGPFFYLISNLICFSTIFTSCCRGYLLNHSLPRWLDLEIQRTDALILKN